MFCFYQWILISCVSANVTQMSNPLLKPLFFSYSFFLKLILNMQLKINFCHDLLIKKFMQFLSFLLCVISLSGLLRPFKWVPAYHSCLHCFTENSWTCDCSLEGQISVRRLRKKLYQWSRDITKGKRSYRRGCQSAGHSTLPWRTSSAWH